MHPLLRVVAHGVLVWLVATSAAAQTPAPPNWHDGVPSVYSTGTQKENKALGGKIVEQTQATDRKLDTSVVRSAHEEPIRSEEPRGRRLAPPTIPVRSNADAAAVHGEGGTRRLMDFGIATQSIYTIVTALTIVIGSFLLFAWALRRGSRGRTRGRGMLPAEAVSVLGKVRLTGRQAAELLRVGNKLVLVAVTPGGAEALTEVTDPAEVDRLVGLCQQHDRHSTTKAFEQVFQNLTRESAADGFLGADALPTSLSPVAAAYRSQRGSGRA